MTRLSRRAWSIARAHPVVASIALLAVLAIVLPVGNYLLSPLWTRTALHEASPLEVTAPVSAPAASSLAPPTTGAGAASTPGTASASTPAPAGSGPRLVARGMFAGADDFHFGRGDALLIEVAPQRYTLRFENFSVRNGPDLFVYLSDDAGGYGKTVLKLGGLRATDGAFNYEVPAGTDVSRFRSAIVWCDQFSQLFATAALR